MTDTPEYLTIPAAVARFGLSRSSLYRMFVAGDVHPVKIGSRTMIPAHELRALFEAAPRAEFRAPPPKAA